MKDKSLRHLTIWVFTLLLSFTLIQNSYAGSQQNTVDLEFIQTAPSGKLAAVPGKPGQYKLTLNKPNLYVSYFSDRPKRITGLMPLHDFIQLWHDKKVTNDFAETPPNAAIETVAIKMMVNKHRLSLVATLSDPHYNAKANTMTYTLSALSTHNHDPKIKQIKLGFTVLFIDGLDMHWNPGGF